MIKSTFLGISWNHARKPEVLHDRHYREHEKTNQMSARQGNHHENYWMSIKVFAASMYQHVYVTTAAMYVVTTY